jgi:hypothetical protein
VISSKQAWRIVVEPVVEGGRLAVRSEDLDAPFDDVIDLVRYCHPVVETG